MWLLGITVLVKALLLRLRRMGVGLCRDVFPRVA
jgi:hypothetical protein